MLHRISQRPTGNQDRRPDTGWQLAGHSPYTLSLLPASVFIPPSVSGVSVDSGRVAVSSNHIIRCFNSGTVRNRAAFSPSSNCRSCGRVWRYWGQSLWRVHPAKSGIHTYCDILKHLYPFVYFKCVNNIFCFRTKKKNKVFPLSRIGQFDYWNALLFFQVLVNINKSILLF